MSASPLRGSTTTTERNRARLRQQPSPRDFKTSGEVVHLDRAARRPHQEEKSDRIELSGDNSKPFQNIGRVLYAIRRVHDLVWHRHGHRGCPAEYARGVFCVLASLDALAGSLDTKFKPDLSDWTKTHLPSLTSAAKKQIRDDLADCPFEVTGTFIGEQLGLLEAERIALAFWDAEAIDATPEARIERKRKADRDRQAAKRRKAGVPSKGVLFAEAQALNPGASRSAIYRMLAKEKAAKPKKGGPKGGI